MCNNNVHYTSIRYYNITLFEDLYFADSTVDIEENERKYLSSHL